MQEFSQGLFLVTTLIEDQGNRTGQKEKLNCNIFAEVSSAEFTGPLKVEWASLYSNRGKRTGP